LKNLVVSGPKSKGWIVSCSFDLLFDLFFHVDEEFLGGGIDAIAEHEIVEEHDALS
jgi:hypothetical protein